MSSEYNVNLITKQVTTLTVNLILKLTANSIIISITRLIINLTAYTHAKMSIVLNL